MSFFKPQTHEAVGSKGMLGGTLCTVSLELLRSVNLEFKRRFLVSSLECARFFFSLYNLCPNKGGGHYLCDGFTAKISPLRRPRAHSYLGLELWWLLEVVFKLFIFCFLFSMFSMVVNILKHIFQPFCPHPRHQFSVQLWRQCCTRC